MVAVDICNLALGYLGDSATVMSIAPPDPSVQAQQCARFYPMAVSMMLEAHEWSFITKRVQLAVLATTQTGRWGYTYALPSDASKIISVLPGGCYTQLLGIPYASIVNRAAWDSGWGAAFWFERRDQEWWRDFQLEVNASGQQVILSNVCDAIARYTTTQVQPGVFPALFTNALAHLLASMLAGPILKGDVGAKKSQSELQLSQAFLGQAMTKDANQKHDAPRPEPVWMRDR